MNQPANHTTAHILGFPRIGAQRELKFALEGFWRGERSEAELRRTGAELRQRHWALQREAGLDAVTVGDFAWYDTTLTLAATLGALPARFGFDARTLSLVQYFELARGNAAQPAMEMTKWFDTNYHHLVPELTPDTAFAGGVNWLLDEVDEAQALGHRVKAVLLGPVSFLWLSKGHGDHAGFDRLSLLPRVVQAYRRVLDEDPQHWEARYNLERTLWLEPEADDGNVEVTPPPAVERPNGDKPELP